MGWQEIAARQLGLVTLEQLYATGLSRSRRRSLEHSGVLVRRHRNVLGVAGAPVTVDQRRLAAVLAHPAAVLSYRAAAGACGAANFGRADPEVTIPYARSARLEGVTVHRSRRLQRVDIIKVGPFPRVTRPSRTLIDLANTDIAQDILEEVGADLLLAFPQEQRRLRGSASPRIRGLFGEFIDSGRRPPHPGLERRLLKVIRGDPRLPEPVIHLQLETPDGSIEVDLAWPDVRLAAEADSARWHSSPRHLRQDRARDQALGMIGWAVARFTWEQVRDTPGVVVDRLLAIRAARRPCG